MSWQPHELVVGVYLSGAPVQQQSRAFSLENPNLPLNSPEIWEQVFGQGRSTDAGITVDERTALMYAPVWQAVNLISSAAACLPFHHYRRMPEISPTASEKLDTIQDYLVSVSPSGGVEPDDYLTSIQFWESFMVDALLWNNAYAYISYDGAMRPRQLRLLNPDRTGPEVIDGQLIYVTEYSSDYGPKLKALQPWEVLHVRGLCPKGYRAPPFIEYARNSIALGLAQQRFASKFFAHGGRVGGILELPMGMPKPARDTIEDGFRKTYEDSDAPFKTVILRDSAKFHQAQVSPNDAQMVEGTEEQVRMIARWFGLSPALLGISGSVSYNSKEQDNQAFLDHCLKRWLRKIAAECGIKLLAPSKQRSEFFAHDVSDFISMDAAKQAQAFQIYRQMEVMSANDVRTRLGMLPRDGGDEYRNPATSSPLAIDPNSTDQQPHQDPTPQDHTPPDMPSQRSIDWRARRVLFNLTHVARQKARNRRSFGEWLDGGFRPQREEWNQIAAGEPEPTFFVQLAEQFNQLVSTVTEDGLAPGVDAITTQWEQES